MADIYVVTGTRKGIGKDICDYYLAKGHIVFGCSRGESSIEHANYSHYQLDVSDENAVASMINVVRKKCNRIDVLINNAGIASMNHLLTTPYKTLQKVFATNMFGTYLFCREVGKVMTKQYQGRIINFSTVAVPLRLEGEAAYAASKAAIVNFTEVAAKELAPFGITVNAIGPTPVPTDLMKNVPINKVKLLLDQQSIKRMGTFKDIINVLDFFIDTRSDFVTGQVIYLGGVNR